MGQQQEHGGGDSPGAACWDLLPRGGGAKGTARSPLSLPREPQVTRSPWGPPFVTSLGVRSPPRTPGPFPAVIGGPERGCNRPSPGSPRYLPLARGGFALPATGRPEGCGTPGRRLRAPTPTGHRSPPEPRSPLGGSRGAPPGGTACP